MHRDFRLYLDDILDAVQQIRIYTEGMHESDFSKDRKTQDAVIRNLEIIGEAAGLSQPKSELREEAFIMQVGKEQEKTRLNQVLQGNAQAGMP
ncbi:HepT-like ribonuclease domain-containing protein [Desulfonatronospira sp.]|uniref:HepT-like ribonuclease domain-containing protein n=1 Tax=Desulfonatronospira sp. TaxID=1962951 RepID=UPI003418A145